MKHLKFTKEILKYSKSVISSVLIKVNANVHAVKILYLFLFCKQQVQSPEPCAFHKRL